jgi:hypothetical protein
VLFNKLLFLLPLLDAGNQSEVRMVPDPWTARRAFRKIPSKQQFSSFSASSSLQFYKNDTMAAAPPVVGGSAVAVS